MRTNRVSILAAVAALSLGLTTACGVIGGQAAKSTVVIGADLELSGADAAIGLVYQQAMNLEVSQINAAGGADGHPVKLDIMDNKSDPHVSATNIATLADEPDLVAMVTGSCAECLAAVQQTLNTKKIPTVSLASADLQQGLRYIFKLNPNAEDDADQLVSEMQNDPDNPVHKYAILASSGAYGDSLIRDVKAQATKQDANLVSTQRFAATDTDNALHGPIEQAASKNPEAIIVAASPTQAADVTVVARSVGYKGPFYFDATAAGNLFEPSATAKGTNGARMVAPQSLVISDIIATSPAQTARKQWFNAYTSKYAVFSAYSLYAADAVQVITTAIGGAHGVDHDSVRNIIEGTQMDGLSGPLRFTPDNHSGLTPQALTTVTVDNGRWHLATA